jgi:hypothetical protein
VRRLHHVVETEWARWPSEHRAQFLYGLQQVLRDLMHEQTAAGSPRVVGALVRSAHS